MRLDGDACRERFSSSRVAHLGTAGADGQPHLVPITFAMVGDAVVTAVDRKPKTTWALRRLRTIAENPRVAVLTDHYDDDWRHLWWVRVDGDARILDPPEIGGSAAVGTSMTWDDAVSALTAKYPPYVDHPPDGPVIVVEPRRWSGWAFADAE